jgi:hypothetical protein
LDLLLKVSEENPDFDDKMIGDEISLFMTAVTKFFGNHIFTDSYIHSVINAAGLKHLGP